MAALGLLVGGIVHLAESAKRSITQTLARHSAAKLKRALYQRPHHLFSGVLNQRVRYTWGELESRTARIMPRNRRSTEGKKVATKH
jgi:hypothetical protein